MAIQTQQYSYKQGCGVGAAGVKCFRADSESFFKFDKVGVVIEIVFLHSVELRIGVLLAFVDADLR